MIPEHVQVLETNQEWARWHKIKDHIKILCQQADIAFAFKIQPNDVSSFAQHKILVFYIFDLVYSKPLLEEFNQQCIKNNKQMLIVCDSFFDDTITMSNLTVISDPKLLSLCSSFDRALYHIDKKSKLFNCFIHRVEPVRQSWFYFLYLHNLLDNGYVSFLLYQIHNIESPLDLFDSNHYNGLNGLEKFNQAYNALRDFIPYRNFNDNENLSHLVSNSKYSLILETYANIDDHYAIYISEKTIRSLEHPCLDLIFGQPGTYDCLKKYNIMFNEKLAKVDDNNWVIRQQNILNVLTQDTVDANIEHMYEQCNHNRDLFKGWYQEIASPEYYRKYIDLL